MVNENPEFQDIDTETHDEIVLALLDPKQMYAVLKATILKDIVFSFDVKSVVAAIGESRELKLSESELKYIQWVRKKPDEALPSFLDIRTEVPLAHKQYIIGFIDLKVMSHGLTKFPEWKLEIRPPIPTCFVEVKTRITSFGETMRQINRYRHYIRADINYLQDRKLYFTQRPPFILVTPDDRFKSAFEAQGIYHYKWQDDDASS